MFWYRSENNTANNDKELDDAKPCNNETNEMKCSKIWIITINDALYGYLHNSDDVDRLISKLHISACSDLDPTSELVITHDNTKTKFQITQKYKNHFIPRLRCIYDIKIQSCSEINTQGNFNSDSENESDDESNHDDGAECVDGGEDVHTDIELPDNNQF